MVTYQSDEKLVDDGLASGHQGIDEMFTKFIGSDISVLG